MHVEKRERQNDEIKFKKEFEEELDSNIRVTGLNEGIEIGRPLI